MINFVSVYVQSHSHQMRNFFFVEMQNSIPIFPFNLSIWTFRTKYISLFFPHSPVVTDLSFFVLMCVYYISVWFECLLQACYLKLLLVAWYWKQKAPNWIWIILAQGPLRCCDLVFQILLSSLDLAILNTQAVNFPDMIPQHFMVSLALLLKELEFFFINL